MRFFQTFASVVGLLAVTVAADADKQSSSPSVAVPVTTVVVPSYVTYCPSSTTFSYKNTTYTVTTATNITISNCPCEVVYSTPPPVTTTTLCSPSSPGGPSITSTTVVTPPPSTYLATPTPTPSASKTRVSPTVATVNAAQQLGGSVGALAAIAGAMAMLF